MLRPAPKPPLKPLSAPKRLQRRWDPVPLHVKEEVLERAGYRCERCGVGGTLQMQHVLNRSQGRQDLASMLIALCGPCHEWVTTHPADARRDGWSVSRYKR